MADKSLQAIADSIVSIAKGYPQIPRDVEKIREAVCGGILDSLINIDKNISSVFGGKKGDISQIGVNAQTKSDKSDYGNKIVKATSSIESILKQILQNISKGGASTGFDKSDRNVSFTRDTNRSRDFKDPNMSKAIDLAAKLKSIRLKDLLFANRKIKKIKNILNKFREMFSKFKSNEEVQQTISFAESTIGMMKSLANVEKVSRLAKKGVKAIEKIILGGKRRKGLLAILRAMGENKDIQKGIEAAKMLKAACTSLFISCLMLVGIAVVGIPAMLGALILRGVIWLLTKTFKLLTKATESVLKGSLVLLIMSTSVILFALGLGLMAKAVRKMEWKDVGIMLASIIGLGLAVAGIGLLSIPIAIGSMVLLMIGVSLGLFAITMLIWRKLDVKEAMGNIKLAVEGLREVFGLELGKGDDKKSFGARLGGGLMDLAMAILNFGKSFFIMGSILLAGAALGILYIGLKNWQNFHGAKEAVANMKIAISGLREVFGLEEPDRDEGFGSKLKKLGGGIIDLAVTILQAGSALVQIGVLTLATGLSVLIRESLKGWANFDSKQAITNLKTAISGLRDIFGLEEPDRDEDFGSKLKKLGGGIIDLAVTILQAGSALLQIGVLTLATGLSVLIRESLKGWANFDPKPAITNLKTAMNGLRDIFGLSDPNDDIDAKLESLGGGILDLAVAIIQAGTTLIQLGVLSFAIGVSALIRESLKKWQDFNPTPAIANLKTAMNGLKKIFGLETPQNPIEKVGSFFGDLVDIGLLLVKMGKTLIVMGTLSMATGMSIKILHALREWEHANISRTAIVNMRDAINGLKKVFGLDQDDKKSFWDKVKSFGTGLLDMGLTMMNSGKILREVGTITVATAMSVKIRESLESWKTYPQGATENLKKAIDSLKTIFGFDDDDEEKKDFDYFKGELFELGATMMKSKSVLYKMGTIAVAVGMMGMMRDSLMKWETYKEEKAIANLEDATTRLLNLFGLSAIREQEQKTEKEYGWIGRNLGAFGRFVEDAGSAIAGGVKSVVSTISTQITSMPKLAKVNAIATAVGLLEPMRESLTKWENYNPGNTINNIKTATNGVIDIMVEACKKDKIVTYGRYLGTPIPASEHFVDVGKNMSKGIGHLVEGLKKLQNVDTDDVKPLEKVVSTVNQLDITKTWYMTEFFKAFSKIGESPISGFIKAVNKFTDSCEEMAEALNNFEPLPEGMTGGGGGGNSYSLISTGGEGSNVNSSELAAALAQALRAVPLNVRTDISDIRLVVNNETGRRVILTLDN